MQLMDTKKLKKPDEEIKSLLKWIKFWQISRQIANCIKLEFLMHETLPSDYFEKIISHMK